MPKQAGRDEIIEFVGDTYGDNKIFKLPSKLSSYTPNNFVSSGLYCLNEIVSGDYKCFAPRGKIIELYGPESVGKTTLALACSKEVANEKQRVLFCDAEHGLNPMYAAQMNINSEYFYFFQPEDGEEAFTMSEKLLQKFDFDLYVLDSVGGIIPKAMLEGKYSESSMGSTARLMAKAIKRLAPLLAKRNTAAIFVNQLSSKIGGYGNPEETQGGRKLKYYLWVRIECRAPRGGKIIEKIAKGKIGDVQDESEDKEEKENKSGNEIGTTVNIKTVKNKLYAPYRKCSLKIIYGKGFDKKYDFLLYLNAKGIIKWKKSRLNYKGKSYLVDKFLDKYKKDIKFKKQIRDEIDSKKDAPLIFTKQKSEKDE